MGRAVLVLGVARSGTSMAAGILSHLGVDMGEADNPSDMNPRGAYENPAFLNLTTNLQSVNIGSCAHVVPKTIEIICNQYSEGRDFWGFKSAVTHHCLDAFLPHLENPHLVVTWRNPLDVAKSWMKLNEAIYGNEDIDFRWALENMVRDMERLAVCVGKHRDIPMTATTYEELKHQPIRFAQRVAQALGIKPTRAMRASINEFILPEYSTLG